MCSTHLQFAVIVIGIVSAAEGAAMSPPGKPRTHVVGECGKCATETFGARQVVRHGPLSYVVYPNLARKWVVLARTLDHRAGTFSDPVEIAPGTDDHTVPAMARDSRGTLHVVSGGHGPLYYVRTTKPDDISSWTKTIRIGSGTYPNMVIDRRDCLYVFYRGPGGNELSFQRRPAGRDWTKPFRVGRTRGATFYIMGLAQGNEPGQQSLHVVGHFYYTGDLPGGRTWPRESYGYRIRPWYLVSRDGGGTWGKADGTGLTLPVTDLTIDVLFDFAEPYDVPWSVDVAIDSQHKPHILCTWSPRRSYAQIAAEQSTLCHMVWDGRRWKSQPVRFPQLQGRHFSHSTVIYAADTLHVALSTASLHVRAAPPAEQPRALWHLWSRDGETWRGRKVTQQPENRGINEPKWKLPDASGELELLWTVWPRTGPRAPQRGWTLCYEAAPARGSW